MDAFFSFAGLLDYPTAKAGGHAARLAGDGLGPGPEAAEGWRGFRDFLDRSPLAAVEDAYVAAFDLEPSTCLYVGYHLFGDTSRRGPFLVELKELYRRHGFEAGRELPDHLPVLLRFLGAAGEFAERRELIEDCLLPAVEKIGRGLAARRHPYAPAFEALRGYLAREGHSGPGTERTE